jgi:hypothetical protein
MLSRGMARAFKDLQLWQMRSRQLIGSCQPGVEGYRRPSPLTESSNAEANACLSITYM